MQNIYKALPALSDFSEVSHWLAFKGWSEGSGGNLSLRIAGEDIPEALLKAGGAPVPLPLEVPALAGQSLFVSGTETRARQIVGAPEKYIGLYKICADGASYVWLAGNDRPTSEMPSHCAIHNVLCDYRPDHKAIVHTHPPKLIALTHIPKFRDARVLSDTILGMQSEARVQLPEGIGHLGFQVPGSLELGLQSAEEVKKRHVVLWHMHGALATGKDLSHALDQLEVVEKAADIYGLLRHMNIDPVGMKEEDLIRSMEIYGRLERYKNAFDSLGPDPEIKEK